MLARPMIRAAALITGPILFAALFFQLQAPGRGPGVYVEVESRSGGGGSTYPLTGYAIGETPPPPDVTANTLAVNGVLRSFFIVDPERSNVSVSATSTKLYFLVMNNADEAFRSEPAPLPATIHHINPRVYRITSEAIEPDRPLALQYYRRILARVPGSRATMELLVGLVIQDASGQRRMYSVRFGPGT